MTLLYEFPAKSRVASPALRMARLSIPEKNPIFDTCFGFRESVNTPSPRHRHALMMGINEINLIIITTSIGFPFYVTFRYDISLLIYLFFCTNAITQPNETKKDFRFTLRYF